MSKPPKGNQSLLCDEERLVSGQTSKGIRRRGGGSSRRWRSGERWRSGGGFRQPDGIQFLNSRLRDLEIFAGHAWELILEHISTGGPY